MSGAKGGVVIIPAVLGGAATIALFPFAAAFAGVNAVIEAKRRVESERTLKEAEQNKTNLKGIEELLGRLAATANKSPEPAAEFSEKDQRAAIKGDLKCSSPEDESAYRESLRPKGATSIPAKTPIAEAVELQQIIVNLRDLLKQITIPLPSGTNEKIARLNRENNIAAAAGIAREIRKDIDSEKKRIEQEMAEATKTLNDLPPDFPKEICAVVKRAANGEIRFDEELRTAIAKARKDADEIRRKNAAIIINDKLAKMGYQTSPVSESLFVGGGTVYIRNESWADGYCVKMGVEGEKINFFVQKDSDTDTAHDAEVEQLWKDEFETFKKELAAESGIKIEVKELSAPGAETVPPMKNIPINTGSKEPAGATILKGAEGKKGAQNHRTIGGK